MTRRKPAPEARCPYCDMTFLALTRTGLAETALAHHEAEHPEIAQKWQQLIDQEAAA